MKVTILGCGGSSGVPLIGNVWGDCDPKEPRNRRRRVSILVEEGDRVEKDQVLAYAQRKGMAVDDVERWLAPVLAYEP